MARSVALNRSFFLKGTKIAFVDAIISTILEKSLICNNDVQLAMTNTNLMEVCCNLCGATANTHIDLVQAPLPRKTQKYFNGLASTSFKICPTCGLVFLSPRPQEHLFLAFYNSGNRNTLSHQHIVSNEQSNLPYHHSVVEFIEKNISISNGSAICDVGCGYGTFIALLRDRYNANVMGLELSEDAVKFATTHYQLNIRQNRLEELQESEHFDLLTSIAVVEHLFDPLSTLEQFKNRVKVGGHVLIVVPDLEKLELKPLNGGRLQTVFKIVHLYYFTNKTLTAMLHKAGFTPIATTKFSLITKQGELWVLARRDEQPTPMPEQSCGWKKTYRYVKNKTRFARAFAFSERVALTLLGESTARKAYNTIIRKHKK